MILLERESPPQTMAGTSSRDCVQPKTQGMARRSAMLAKNCAAQAASRSWRAPVRPPVWTARNRSRPRVFIENALASRMRTKLPRAHQATPPTPVPVRPAVKWPSGSRALDGRVRDILARGDSEGVDLLCSTEGIADLQLARCAHQRPRCTAPWHRAHRRKRTSFFERHGIDVVCEINNSSLRDRRALVEAHPHRPLLPPSDRQGVRRETGSLNQGIRRRRQCASPKKYSGAPRQGLPVHP